jgi:YidC/Oxa1 family membrane protein insertase
MIIANVLQPLVDLAHAVLEFWHDQAGFGWGASIIMLTVCVRLAILPLTFRQVKAMQKLQVLQPEIKKIQERYKDDRQRMNQEMLRFYQENKVNPLGACLPLLLQLPFFMALFFLLRDEPDLEGQSFLFIDDLAERVTDPGPLIALIVLYVVSQLGASAISMASADKTQRTIMLALPFVFVVFVVNFPAGLLVYWITTNFWTIGQQLVVRRLYPRPEILAEAGLANGATAAAAGPKAPAAAARGGNGGPQKAPPPPPRKKKKRSGRRR